MAQPVSQTLEGEALRADAVAVLDLADLGIFRFMCPSAHGKSAFRRASRRGSSAIGRARFSAKTKPGLHFETGGAGGLTGPR
jgi:hypothetical protein